MPTIGRADITVHYDGKNLPREAREIAGEAGGGAGEEFSDAFDEEAKKGFDETGKDLEKSSEGHGKTAGEKYGVHFSDSVDKILKRDLQNVSDNVGKIFADDKGLDKYRDQLRGVDGEMNRLSITGAEVREALRRLNEQGVVNDAELTHLVGVTRDWEKSNRDAAIRADELAAKSHAAAEALDEVHKAAIDANREFNAQRLDDYNQSLADSTTYVRHFKRDLADLADIEKDSNALHRDGETRTRGLANAMDDLDRAALRLNPNLESHHKVLRQIADVAKNGGTEEHYRGLTSTIGTLAREAEQGAAKLLSLGDGIDTSGNKAEKAGPKFGKLFGAFSKFDPGDNLGQLILLIIAVAGPAAALVSALAAQIVVLATVATAALVGVGGLVAAFIGLFKNTADLPKNVQDAAAALKGLLTPLKGLQDTLTTAVFKDLAGPFRDLGKALPGLGSGVAAIGDALGGFLKTLTTGITKNIGGINDLLKGFAPIIGSVGDAVVKLIGVFGGLLKAATPFATTFAANLDKTISKWSDWINSIEGQQAIQNWIRDAQPLLGSLNGLLGDVATTFSNLITPGTISDAQQLLGDIGRIVIALGNISVALSPALVAVGAALALVIEFASKLDPVLQGVGHLAQGVVAFFTPIVNYLGTILEPAFKIIGLGLDNLAAGFQIAGQILSAVFSAVPAIFAPINTALDKAIGGITSMRDAIFRDAQPAIAALRDLFSAVGEVVGTFLTGLFSAIGATKLVGAAAAGAASGVSPFAGALQGLAGFLGDVAYSIRTNLLPAVKEIDWSKVTSGMDKIISIAPNVGSAFQSIGQMIVSTITVLGSWGSAAAAAANTVITAIQGAGSVIAAVARGDIPGALAAAGVALANTGKASTDLAAKVGSAVATSNTEFGKFNSASNNLQVQLAQATAKGKAALADFEASGKGNLQGLSTKLGLTGDASVAFRGVVAGAAKDAGVKLADLANAKDLPELQRKLGVAGGASRTDFANKIIAAMNDSGTSISALPPQIGALVAKYGTIPAKKNTDVTIDKHDSLYVIAQVQGALAQLVDKRINVTTYYSAVGTDSSKGAAVGRVYANRYGGVIAGGKQIAGGKLTAFANGGIVNRPTRYGNSLFGEAGAEAIVPLTGALGSVDKSVRGLAALARGRSYATAGTPGKQVSFSEGAIRVYSNSTDGRQVASSVLERFDAVVGSF